MTRSQLASQEPQALHRQALEALEDNRPLDAARALRQAVLRAPAWARLWNDLGVVLEALGHPAEALRCYRTALDRDAGHPEAMDNYSQLKRQMNFARLLQVQPWTSTTAEPARPVSAAAKCRAAAAS
jgi:Flp pilus assembly protein TadD